MEHHENEVRLASSVVAVTVVAGAMLALGSYSNAKFEVAAATVQQRVAVPAIEVAIAPARIEVIGVRSVKSARAPAPTPTS